MIHSRISEELKLIASFKDVADELKLPEGVRLVEGYTDHPRTDDRPYTVSMTYVSDKTSLSRDESEHLLQISTIWAKRNFPGLDLEAIHELGFEVNVMLKVKT